MMVFLDREWESVTVEFLALTIALHKKEKEKVDGLPATSSKD